MFRGGLGDREVERAGAGRQFQFASFHHFAPGAAHQADDNARNAAIAHDEV